MNLKRWESTAVIITAFISIIALLRTFDFSKSEIYIYDLKDLVIGFNRQGPVFSFLGTFESRNKDSLITLIELKVVRTIDNAEHRFKWLWWQQPIFGKDLPPTTLATAFLLTMKQPLSEFITFRDENTLYNLEGKLAKIRAKFDKYLINNNLKPYNSSTQIHWGKIFNKFVASEEADSNQEKTYFETYTFLQKTMYWETGSYSAVIEIHTSSPDSIQKFSFDFELTDIDYINLTSNYNNIIWDYCGLPITLIYNTAQPVVKNFKRL